MILTKIKIHQFKGIFDEKEITIDDFNLIVGQNDAGKSTILKSLDCFLNSNNPSPDDLNNKSGNNLITITLHFNPSNQSIIIDQNIETTFEEEELVNDDNELVIKKVWDVSKSRITANTFIERKQYVENDFISLTEAQLMTACGNLGIDTQKANGEDFNNKEKRQKIRQHNIDSGIDFTFVVEKLPTSGSNRFKIIHDRIKGILPRFEYFKADTSLSETDTAIQKFFKTLAIKTLEEEIDTSDVEDTIQSKLGEVLEKITTKINDVVPSEENVEPVIDFDWTKLVSTKFKSTADGTEVPLSSRGDGFRRITIMAYFEYLAEQQKSEHQKIIFGLEEPETFLHPSAQESLFHKLIALCENDYQVIVSTHSPIIVSNTKKDKITHIHKTGGTYNVEQQIADITSIAFDLGIKVDNQFISLFDSAKVLLLVEGIDDANALNHLCQLYKVNGVITQDFAELEIAIIPIGGCDSIKHWVSLNLLSTLNKPFLIFQDSDKTNAAEQSPTKTALENLGFVDGTDFIISKKRNLENYISPAALNRLVPNSNLHYDDWSNVKQLCGKHQLAGRLGGRGVADRHFKNLTFDELRSTFFDGNEDEFLNIYTLANSKL
ncbi:ATP-dependent nuclease [Tenacibaculum amylolyticum]|uniref:ATP-dependent nuclease n=1 Tax=Tenacibaculum amylolyticum TaxID=104269 RepID=UPI0038954526